MERSKDNGRINLDFTTYRTLLKGWATLYRMCVKMWHKKHPVCTPNIDSEEGATQNNNTEQNNFWPRRLLRSTNTSGVLNPVRACWMLLVRLRESWSSRARAGRPWFPVALAHAGPDVAGVQVAMELGNQTRSTLTVPPLMGTTYCRPATRSFYFFRNIGTIDCWYVIKQICQIKLLK